MSETTPKHPVRTTPPKLWSMGICPDPGSAAQSNPETTRRRQHKVTLTFPSWTEKEVPEGAYKVAVQRTAHLAARSFHVTPEQMAVSAYLQGIEDCAQVFFNRGAQLPGVTDV